MLEDDAADTDGAMGVHVADGGWGSSGCVGGSWETGGW